ncbi:MAG: hypothetical protein DIU68_019630 [Chloroflexota bacterium]|nr:MAG: hypothetical protein DIU68_16405 [Chloroflexota bacterium]
MIAHKQQYQKQPLDERIIIVPTTAAYADQMVEVMCAAYGVSPEETYRPAQFKQQARIFPEGQFVAIDTETDKVVGLTISMRVDYDPKTPLLERWAETTNYG